MSENQQVKHYHSGFVTIIGRPNVGKSTLLNQILQTKVAITTPKPQTTRETILGVKHFGEEGQIVFLDTPGVHKAKGGLNLFMLESALSAISDGDLVYLMLEAGPRFIDKDDLGDANRKIMETIAKVGVPCFLVLNKIDLVEKHRLLAFIQRLHDKAEIPFAGTYMISAKTGDGVEALVADSWARMPEGPPYFPDQDVTDRTLRFLAAELVREQVFLQTGQEIPYACAVRIVQYKQGASKDEIMADVLVERDSQKGIIIGKGASKLKAIGTAARKAISEMTGKRLHLDLQVKVEKGWSQDPRALAKLGYSFDE